MRIKQFEDKIYEDPDFMELRGHFAKTCATEGLRVDKTARLLKLCRTAYNLGANCDLEADPPAQAPVQGPPPRPAPPELTAGGPDGTEETDSREGTGDTP